METASPCQHCALAIVVDGPHALGDAHPDATRRREAFLSSGAIPDDASGGWFCSEKCRDLHHQHEPAS